MLCTLACLSMFAPRPSVSALEYLRIFQSFHASLHTMHAAWTPRSCLARWRPTHETALTDPRRPLSRPGQSTAYLQSFCVIPATLHSTLSHETLSRLASVLTCLTSKPDSSASPEDLTTDFGCNDNRSTISLLGKRRHILLLIDYRLLERASELLFTRSLNFSRQFSV
ncbi:hypothetical protein PENSPDRAFT_5005 [Peniophora sp. CONT]|nr:hypothetical protein PENSPDRAFT_5005 [Peniophora sp. CONT]